MSANQRRPDSHQSDDAETWLRRPLGIQDLKKAITYADDMEPELRKEFLFHYITLFSNEYVNEKEMAHHSKHDMPFKSCPTTPACMKKPVNSVAPVVMDDLTTPLLRRRLMDSANEFPMLEPTYPDEKAERDEEKRDEDDSQENELEKILSPQETQENRIGLLEEMYKVLEELPGIEEYLKLFFNILRTTQLPIETLAEKTVDFLTDISYCPEDDKFEDDVTASEDYNKKSTVNSSQANNQTETLEQEEEVSPSPYLADTPPAESIANFNHLKDLQSGLDLIQGAYSNILKDLAVRHKAAANVAASAQKLASEMLSRRNEWCGDERKVDEMDSVEKSVDIQLPLQCSDDSS